MHDRSATSLPKAPLGLALGVDGSQRNRRFLSVSRAGVVDFGRTEDGC